jgi:squalene-hopene/tetraprenyl-beta-curcumene cyclase
MQIANWKLEIGKKPWRTFLFLLVLVLPAAFSVQGCAKVRSDSAKQAELNARENRSASALTRAARYLIEHQDADGAWRSDTYGVFKDGPSLTPLVLDTLLNLPSSKESEEACRKAATYLAKLVRPDGTIDEGPIGLSYPVYTAVFAVCALSRPAMAEFRPARDAWLRFLRQRQLTEELGWQPEDKAYGGWGYSHQIPRKPKVGEPLIPLTESNLSATTLALEALQAAGCPSDDPTFRKALIFVGRCQNFCEDKTQRDPAFDDGGFFFIYDDAVRNKAGVAGKDRMGRERFSSYGSTTADGLRALLICGIALKDPRVQAAWTWLEKNFHSSVHPGHFNPDREMNRQAVYFYYSLSLAKAFRFFPAKGHWAALAEDLQSQQRSDGSWANSAVAVREDDPVVATCLAAQTLSICKELTERETAE